MQNDKNYKLKSKKKAEKEWDKKHSITLLKMLNIIRITFLAQFRSNEKKRKILPKKYTKMCTLLKTTILQLNKQTYLQFDITIEYSATRDGKNILN